MEAIRTSGIRGIKEVNDSQHLCRNFSLMWRKPDGSLIPLTQRYMPEVAGQPPQLNPNWYTGPTQCPHRAAGCPCYGPFPDVIKLPSMLTPKRAGKGSERGGKKDDDKDAKKAPTQRTLEQSFGAPGAASSSLQLTN